MIELKNVSFSYFNKKYAIKNITIQIKEKSTVLVGPNGSGKTTLLKIISLIYRPQEGEIKINNLNPWKIPKKQFYNLKRQIVYVHEKPLFFRGTILDNLTYPLEIRGITKEAAEEKALEVLRTYDLEKYAHRKRNQLSAGEGQLLSIIRALLIDPKIIALDEPTSNLDQEKRELLADILKEKIREGKTILISTHDTIFAVEMGEIVFLMNNGEIAEKLERNELIETIDEKLKRIKVKS